MQDTPLENTPPESGGERVPGAEYLLPERALTTIATAGIRKSVSAIHMFALNGVYNHFTRRVFNACLALSFRQWQMLSAEQQAEIHAKRAVPRFQATVGEFKLNLMMAEADRGYDRIYAAMELLYKLEFRFDVMNDLGEEWEMSTRLISQWGRERTGTGLIEWEFPPDILQMLMNPGRYAQIDLKFINSLSSGYAHALYENVVRYVKSPTHLSRRLPLSDWMSLLSVSKKRFKEYRFFKREVLKTALAELEASPGCPVQITLIETKGPNRKVTHLQFRVELKEQLPLLTDMGRGPDPLLTEAIRKLGVSERKITELVVSMEEADLRQCVTETRLRMKRGGVNNAAGYFISLCNANLDEGDADLDEVEEAIAPVLPLETPAPVGSRLAAMEKVFMKMSADDQKAWLQQFAESKASGVLPAMDNLATSTKLAKNVFLGWLLQQGGAQLLLDSAQHSSGD